jgi:putative glycosyl hydrolase-like family 15 (GHL15) protein
MLSGASGTSSRFRSLVLLVSAAVTIVAMASASAATGATPGTETVRLGGSAKVGTTNLPNFSTLVFGMDEYTYISGIKLKSPSSRVLGYKSATEMLDNCGSVDMCASAITYQQALAHDSSYPKDPWVLRNSSGQSITAPAYPHAHLANVGSASYQKQWLTNVAAVEKKYGFNGAYIDSVLGSITGWSGGVAPTLYPTDAAWENAMRSFIVAVGPALKSQGLYVLANAFKGGSNDGSLDVAWWKSLAPYVSGLQAEYWEQSAVSTNRQLYDTNPCCWTGHWISWLDLAPAAQNAGADFFGGMKGTYTDTRAMQYGKASFLLVWNGKGGGFLWMSTDGSDTVQQPLSSRSRLAARLHRRHRHRQPEPVLVSGVQPGRQLHHAQWEHGDVCLPRSSDRHDPPEERDDDDVADAHHVDLQQVHRQAEREMPRRAERLVARRSRNPAMGVLERPPAAVERHLARERLLQDRQQVERQVPRRSGSLDR